MYNRLSGVEKRFLELEDLLANPEIKKITCNINREVIERREYVPPLCETFTSPFTVLRENNDFRFKIHSAAAEQLPGIINNKTMNIEGNDSPDESLKKGYSSRRIIGIVFSGGPAPGGHNVIAGLYDAAKKANPDTKIIGFLMGPDGIIENENVVITREMIDNYRNLGGFGMIKTGRTKIDSDKYIILLRLNLKFSRL